MRTLRIISLVFAVLAFLAGACYADEGMIKAEVIRTLTENSPWDKTLVEVDEVALQGYRAEYDRADSVKVETAKGVRNLGKVTVSVRLFQGNRELKTIWASARVRAFKEAVVALNGLKMNSRITNGDIRLQRIDINEAQDTPSSIEEVSGMIAKRPIPAGTVIKWEYVKPEALVKRGQRIVLMVDNKELRIKSTGVASEDGHSGSVIKARTKTGIEVMGKVTGPDELTVEF